MYWQKTKHTVVLIAIGATIWAGSLNAECSDPFYPLYIEDPQNDYERNMASKYRQEEASVLRPEMVVCGEYPIAVYKGKTYKKGDVYFNGTISEITCDFIKLKTADTEIIYNLIDEDIIEEYTGGDK